jgi:multidrug efflux pump subunit AcrB
MIARLLFTHSRYLSLIILTTIVVGYSSFNALGRQEDPTITPFIAKIETLFPGASPSRVESLVTKPLEEALQEIPELEEIKSTSASGISVIAIETDYRLSLSEIDRVWTEIRDVVASEAERFPEGVMPPVVDDDLITAFVKIMAVSSAEGRNLPPSVLRREAELFADKIRTIPRTKRVMFFGLPEEEIRIELDARKLAQLGMSVRDVSDIVGGADVKVPAGKLTASGSALTIELSGDFIDLEAIRNLQLHTQPDGASLRLQDIATISRGERRPANSYALSNGRRSVLLGVEMDLGYQVDRYSDRFDAFLEDYLAEAPAGLLIETAYDQSLYTETRLQSVAINLLMGVALVILVLLFTLGWRAAAVVAFVLPLCTLLSMIPLLYFAVPIHQMSLTGLVVALGLLVDGSIVMTDEVRKRLIEGLKPIDAMTGAVSRLRVPLLASTLTTVLTFLPMAILEGPAGDFLGSIAISVIVMLVSSMVLALTLTPVLAARLLPDGLSAANRWWQFGAHLPTMARRFRQSLDWSLRFPFAAMALALSLPLTGFFSAGALTNQFFPGTSRDQFYLQVTLPDSASIEDSLGLALAINNDLSAEPLVRRIEWSVGESAPAFYYNMRSNKKSTPNWLEALVLTHNDKKTDALIRRMQRELDRRYPAAQVIVRGIDQGPPVEAPIEVRVLGPNPSTLKVLGEQFRQRLENLPGVTHTKMSVTAAPPKLSFDFDEESLGRLGLTRKQAAGHINDALRGRDSGELLEDTERIPVKTSLNVDEWSSIESVSNLQLPVRGRGSAVPAVPLGSLGEIRLEPNDSPISRRDGVRSNTIQGFLTRGVLPAEALTLLEQDLKANPINLPHGYRYIFGGDSEERAGVVNDLIAPLGIILAALIATILLTFNSWRLTGGALLVCACSFGLSLFALAISGFPLGIQAVIGIIGSIGVSINAAIIILTALQQDAGAARGDTEAIRNVVIDSSRHIVSTTVTTFGGFLPLILEGGKFWPPFAVAIAGGVLLSTVISFYLVPPLFLITLKRRGNEGTLATGVTL